MPSAHLGRNFALTLALTWWVLLLRGFAAILFGVLGLAMPGLSLGSVVLLFGAFCLVDGLLGAWTALWHRRQKENGWLLLVGGLVGIGTGLLTIFQPAVSALALLFYVATWAIATGVVQILGAVRLRHAIRDEWALGLAGSASLALGVLLMAQPEKGALALLWLIASWAVLAGLLLVALAFEVRAAGRRIEAELSGAPG